MRSNTDSHYGSVAKTFHWLTALLILTAFPLGIAAQKWGYDTNEALALKATLFSAHKTVGVLAFFTALGRILWALSQKRPRHLNGAKKLETAAAETAHWLLYGSMLLVPLTGWIHHAATEGFAPIWLPIGQNLPFVPKSESLAAVTSGLHFVLVVVLILTIFAHIAGALKHFIIDKDKTLQRMLPGRKPEVTVTQHQRSFAPLFAALCVWAIALTAGTFGGLFKPHDTSVQSATLSAPAADQPSLWEVTSGSLEIEITQFGQPVTGRFADWAAQITFDETLPMDGPMGSVSVEIAIGSLSLGSVTQQAMGADFFDASSFPTAQFQADIFAEPTGDEMYRAEGTLSLKGTTMPLTLPFTLSLDQNGAAMQGAVSLNRTDFAIGATMPDESNLGFGVDVRVALDATRP